MADAARDAVEARVIVVASTPAGATRWSMRGTTKVRGANIATVRDPDDALQLVSDALDDDGVSFVVLEKAGGSYFVRASYAAPSFIGRDDD